MSRYILFALFCFFLLIPPPAQAGAEAAAVPQGREQIRLSFAPLVRKTAPAVVNIYTKRVVVRRVSPFTGDPLFEQFFGGALGLQGGLSRERVENALGSGVIVQADGLVVTNNHVVRDAEEIIVVLPDGREFPAQTLLTDSRADIALLRIDAKGEALPYVPLDSSESLEVGDLVLAIGNPFGVGQTVTSGIVSALARSSLNINDFNFFIQTDAAINPGNSGGALVDMEGGLVGINTAIYSRSGGSLGIGFAIPAEMVKTVIAAWKSGQSGVHGVVRPWLGISAQKVTADIADSLGFRTPHGVLIAGLHRASPAREAGLRTGDVVTAVNGKEVREPADMKFRMATVALGETAAFSVLRKGKELTLRVKAAPPPEDPPRQETVLRGNHPLDGAKVSNINPAVGVELEIADESGVAVIETLSGTVSGRLVQAGDIIAAVGGQPVKTVKDLDRLLKVPPGRGAWEITLSRGGRLRQIVLR